MTTTRNVLLEIIEKKAKVLIIPHKSPDGDCLGSALTLVNFFGNQNCNAQVLLDEEIPTNYLFLKIPNQTTSKKVIEKQEKFDYAIIVDTSDKKRVGADPAVFAYFETVVVFDHHKTNNSFGDYNIVEMVSSVGELIYNNYVEIGYEIDLTDALGLYTSIVTDTGNLKYSNTTSRTLKIVANLFDLGLEFDKANRSIYGNQALCKVQLKSSVLAQMDIHDEGQIVVLQVTQKQLESTGSKMFHSDGIVEAGRDIAGVEVSVLLKEINENTTKVSMRSKNFLDVADISLIYSGGGHIRAAGCTINKSLDETKKEILKVLVERLSS